MAKVSILVPIYGVEKFIEKCAVSLLEQTFDDIEYIFVNDQTKDKSINILKEVIARYPQRQYQIKIITHSSNKGLAGARNTGIENATGDYILHVDSDDYIESNTIELLYNKAVEENADIVVCDYVLNWNNTNKEVLQVYNVNPSKMINLLLSDEAVTSVWNKLIRRSLYINHNIKAMQGINLGEDFFVIPRLIYFANKIAKVDKALYHYVQLNATSYTKKMSKKNILDVVFVFESLAQFFSDKREYEIYLKSINRGKLRKKLEFILQSDDETLEMAMNLFPEINTNIDTNFLNKIEKIVYNIHKSGNILLMKIFLKMYNILFHAVQILKRRK